MISLTPFQISTLMTAFVALFMGVFVYIGGEKTKRNFAWLLTSMAISAWSIGLFGVVFFIDKPVAWFWQYILDIGGICIPILYFNFVLFLIKKEKGLIFLQIFSLISGTALLVLSFTNLFKTDISPKFGINFWIDPGKLYFLFPLYFVFIVVLATFIIIKEYKNTTDRELKRQLLYILIAQMFGFGGGITNFFPQLFNIYPFGNYFVILYVICVSYAALKHRLFDIKVIATELLIFAIWAFLAVKTLLSLSNIQEFIINGVILGLVFITGVLLIRSMLRDARQREELEKLSKEVQEAYEKENKVRVQDEALLGSIGDGVVAIDSAGKIMFANKAAEEMLGLKNSEMIGKSYEEILVIETENNEKVAKEKNPLHQALNSGKKIVTDATEDKTNTIFYYAKKDGTRFPVAITAAPVILDGKTIGAIDVFRDVTIERQIDKAKSEFVSIASHQLRTPLTAIRWYAEYLMGGKAGKLTKKQAEYMNAVYSGNLRMIKLINMMLNISRLEAGKIKVNKVPTDMKSLLEDIIKEQQFDVDLKKQKLVFECEQKLPQLSTDPALIRQVFQNLISNAIKYTPEGGKIVLSAQKKDEKLLFEVQDNGIGIPENQQNKMFQKLFRADNAMESSAEGTGLGLYGAKMTAEQLGGKIWFESKQGKGTTFFVELPVGNSTGNQ